MPVNPATKTPSAIQELPAGDDQSLPQVRDLVNDRIRSLNAALKLYVQNPAAAAVDLGQFQIVNLADPKNDLDAVNLRTLKKFGGATVDQQVQGTGQESPTIYFTFDGLPFDGEVSPFAQIMGNRAGFTMVTVSVAAVGPPTGADGAVNLLIGGNPVLSADLVLPEGQQGPAYSNAFAIAGALQLNTLIQAVITAASGMSQVTIAIMLEE